MPGDDHKKAHSDDPPESNAEPSGSEETAVKRPRPNPSTPSQITFSTARAVTPEPGALPLWVAGSSPAKFISLDDLIRVNSGLEKMAIAHEIAIDPNFKLEAHVPQNPVEKAVTEQMRRAYWDLLRVDLQKTPPEYQHAFTLVKDIKELIMDLLVLESHAQLRERIESILDLDLLQHQFETRSVDFHKLLTVIVEMLAGLCAPVRDELVAKLKAEQDDVELVKGIFELLEHMKVDMANFTLNQNRGTIERFSAEYEREQFMRALEVDPDGAASTAAWLSLALDGYVAENPHKLEEQEIARSELGDIFSRGYMRLLEPMEPSVPFPETLTLDRGRIEGLSEKYLQLILTSASVFVTSNLAGRQIGERADFKQQLKSQLIVILNDVSWTNYPEKMENVALQCRKLVEEAAGESWTTDQSDALKDQVVSLAKEDHPVRKIARDRIHGFVRSIVKAPGAASIQLPAGMSVIQSELAAFTSKFLLITSHNWKAFGVFYAKLVEAAFKRRLQAHRSSPSAHAEPAEQLEKASKQPEKSLKQSDGAQ